MELSIGPLIALYYRTMTQKTKNTVIEIPTIKVVRQERPMKRSQNDFVTELIYLPRKKNRMFVIVALFFLYCVVTPRFFGFLDLQKTQEAGLDTYRPMIIELAREYRVHPALVAAMIKVESDFRPDIVSPAGARGLMQLMPETAQALDVGDPANPADNIRGGTKYIRSLLDQFGGNLRLAVAAYNAGPGAVKRAGTVPRYAETRRYVEKVLYHFNVFKKHFKA